jgi:hypothetical protein
MKRNRRVSIVLALVVALSACASHAPPNLTPQGRLLVQLDEIVVNIGEFQRAAIALNQVKVCAPTPPTTCQPLLSDNNTRVVVEVVGDVLTTIRAVPAGSKALVLAALDRIDQRLDAAGREKLKVYVDAARTLALGLLGAS